MKFLQFIELMKKQYAPDKEQLRKQILTAAKPRWARIIALSCAVVIGICTIVASGITAFYLIPLGKDFNIPKSLSGISPVQAVIADNSNGNEISLLDGGFKVTTAKNTLASKLDEILEISPKDNFKIKQTSGNTFEIMPEDTLKGNTLYTFKSLLNGKEIYSWAFQTKNPFGIEATSCAGGYCELNSAIWVDFTHSNVENFEECFSITPAVSGTFEHYGKRWVFIPSADFEQNTVYTVTISKNISAQGKTLEKDYTFNFTARNDAYMEYDYLDYSVKCETFTQNEIPAARINASNIDTSSAFVSVYSIENASEFIRLHKTYVNDYMISGAIEDELKTPLINFDAVPYYNGDTLYFNYPQAFETGYYVSVINIMGMKTYHIFQVTTLAVYSISSNGDGTVWINDLETKLPVANITVTDDNGNSYITDNNGIVTLKPSDDQSLRYITINASLPYVCIIKNSEKDAFAKTSLKYYSFINTNSKVYRKGDTVKVWGFTLPRTSKYEEMHSIDLYCSWTDEITTVKPDINGAFTAEFKLSDGVTDENGYIDLLIDGVCTASTYFEIDDYTLPTYSLCVSTDKKCYIAGETVTYTLYAELFDKTPAKNVTVFSNGQSFTTDDKGFATFTEKASIDVDAIGTPFYTSREFSVYQPDGTSVFYYADYAVFKSQLSVFDVIDNGAKLKITVNAVDGSKPDFKGDIADSEITAQLHRVSYIKDEQNGVFNPVTMQTEYETSYTAVDDIVLEQTYITQNGILSIPYQKPTDDAYYYYILKCGQNEYTHYLDGSSGNSFRTSFEYSLVGDDEYDIHDTVKLKLDKDVSGGFVLISLVSGDIIMNKIYEPGNISFEFDERFCPDAYVCGAYFDGIRIVPIELKRIYQKEKRLNIEIMPDKEVYLPGETVNMNIVVTDSEGEPVKAALNINVIDKALDTLAPDYTDIYDVTRFSRANSTIINRSVSTYLPYPIIDLYGEGGGGNSRVRTDYEDTPYFDCITTDIAGNAKASFKLPDSVTSWVINVGGFSQNASIGQTKTEISATKDIFISAYVADKMMVDDTVSVAFKTAGKDFTDYTYTAYLFKDGIQVETKDGAATASQIVNECFYGNTYSEGNYKIQIDVTNGILSDSIEKAFDIVPYNVTDITVLKSELDDTSFENMFESDITINVYDRKQEFYYSLVETMLKKTSPRVDHKLANAIAKSVIYTDKNTLSQNDSVELSRYFTDEGISIYGADGFATVSQAALITAVAADYINTDRLQAYFSSVYENNADTLNTISYYLASAVMGEPVLEPLNILRNDINNFNDEQKIYLALAYAYAGDYTQAQDIFDKFLSQKIISANGIAKFNADSTYESDYLTCVCAVLTSKISDSTAKALVKGVMSGNDEYAVSGLALCAYIESHVPQIQGKNSFGYIDANGKKHTINYPKFSGAVIKAAKNDIGKIKLWSNDENSIMAVSGETAIDKTLTLSQAGNITAYADSTTLKASDTAEFVFDINLDGCEMNSPYAKFSLPHGLKLINAEIIDGEGHCTDDGKIYMSGQNIKVKIKCYVSLSGNFALHAPTIIDKTSGQYLFGNTLILNIQ